MLKRLFWNFLIKGLEKFWKGLEYFGMSKEEAAQKGTPLTTPEIDKPAEVTCAPPPTSSHHNPCSPVPFIAFTPYPLPLISTLYYPLPPTPY